MECNQWSRKVRQGSLKIHCCNTDDPLSSDIVAPEESDSVLGVESAAITPAPVARKRARKAAPKKATAAKEAVSNKAKE
jgi:hypothetical protein